MRSIAEVATAAHAGVRTCGTTTTRAVPGEAPSDEPAATGIVTAQDGTDTTELKLLVQTTLPSRVAPEAYVTSACATTAVRAVGVSAARVSGRMSVPCVGRK